MYTMNLLDKINKPEAESSCSGGGGAITAASNSVRGRPSPLFDGKRNAFICPRCSKSFPTTQALGGHQNAHRRKRNEERWMSIEIRRRKAKESTRSIPCPTVGWRRPTSTTTHDGQMIDFWALELAKPEEGIKQDEELRNGEDENDLNHEIPYGKDGFCYHENQNYHHNHHLNYVNGYEERDFMATFGNEEFPAEAISSGRSHGGGDIYESELITCNRKLNLSLRL